MKIKTAKKGTWRIHGIGLTPSDAIVIKLTNAINEDDLDQTHLQDITGHRSPIIVNREGQTISFMAF